MHSLVERLLRAAHTRLAASGGAAALRLELELLRRSRAPAVVAPLAVRRVLVLAPHMDDEVLGCGGTLAACAARGAEVRVAYLTDGSKGYANASPAGAAPTLRERRLVELRKEEARRAAKILGWSELIFLDLPDGRLAVTDEAVARLARVLAELRPELVYLPFLTDPHPDHWATNGIFLAAARRSGLRGGTQCWGYEVWKPIPANTLVDISDAMALKRAAMREFASQNRDVNYPRAMEGMAAYRSLLSSAGSGFAEAFFAADLKLYARLHCLALDAS
jgi:LmbE family N-acetylglucosaminyl deacetylase